MTQPACGLGGIARFHADEDHIGRSGRGDVGRRMGGHAGVERARLNAQAVVADRIDMQRTANEHDLVAVQRQHAAVVAADRAGAEHCKPHDVSEGINEHGMREQAAWVKQARRPVHARQTRETAGLFPAPPRRR